MNTNTTNTNNFSYVTGTTTVPKYDYTDFNYYRYDGNYWFQRLVDKYMLCDKRTLAELLAMRDYEMDYTPQTTYTTSTSTGTIESSTTSKMKIDSDEPCNGCKRKINKGNGWEAYGMD